MSHISHWARSGARPSHRRKNRGHVPVSIINPKCDAMRSRHRSEQDDIRPYTPLSKGFCPSWSCAFLFPSINHCQHHPNHLPKLLKQHTSDHQTHPSHQSTCLTSDPAAPTRLVTRYDTRFNTNDNMCQVKWSDIVQRTESDATIRAQQEANRFHEGKENSHKANDSSMS